MSSYVSPVSEENRLIRQYGLAMQYADAADRARHFKRIAAACQAEITNRLPAGEKQERSEP